MSTKCTYLFGQRSISNSRVKRAWAGVVEGWVTFREVVSETVGEAHGPRWACGPGERAWVTHREGQSGRYNFNPDAPPTASPCGQSQLVTPAAPVKSSKPLSQTPPASSHHGSPRVVGKEYQKCKLLDITGQKRIVAEGRWSSNNPDQLVHFVPLGFEAVRVWVDTVKVDDAAVWKPNSAIQSMEDAIGTAIAWPEDKVVLL
ncbi:unnamed protein product [Microthlaspi erraticum]|uniref:DUF8039 domain-containing protein n=1 Tax=Microthlaspi erraticum TaxID=1685480 RepID=A0A6D2JPG3_9BRAS|nr:unnamed protein product [Microthlaspi erraticum]